MVLLLFWVLVAGLTAIAANAKNRSAVEGFLIGAVFSVFGLLGFLMVKPLPDKKIDVPDGLLVNKVGQRKCPDCAEMISMEATKCRFCGCDVSPISKQAAAAARKSVYEPIQRRRLVIVLVLAVIACALGYMYSN